MRNWLKRKFRHKRWPHSKYSSGYHQWQASAAQSNGSRLWECIRCGTGVYAWPRNRPPLLHVGETYSWGEIGEDQ